MTAAALALLLLGCSASAAEIDVGDATKDANGFLVHEVTSPYQAGKTPIRVLAPDKLEKGKRYPVVYVLPVEAKDEARFGNGLLEVKKRDLHNRHQAFFVAPTFSHLPWYADHPKTEEIRQESYFLKVVLTAIETRYPVKLQASGRMLLGFSKSGWGAFSLLLRHPEVFGKAAAWDAPLMMEKPNQYGMGDIFGTQENFEKYQISRLLEKRGELLGDDRRLVLLGYGNFREHHEKAHALMDRLKVGHDYRDGPERKHVWDSGWVAEAVRRMLPERGDKPSPEAVKSAVEKSVALLQKSRTEYLNHRDCFSCHHQAYPTLALTVAGSRGFKVDADGMQKQYQLTEKHLAKGKENYSKGTGQGGQVDTAGSALWVLELGGWKPNETTAAVAEYLLLRDKDKDYWRTSSSRPPTEASNFTATYLAVRSLNNFATSAQKERAKERIAKARQWLLDTPARDTEDRVFRLFGLAAAGADAEDIKEAAKDLLDTQREDGGWAQAAKMDSDAYATGTALVALHQVGGLAVSEAAYQRGLKFLLQEQLDDGSWYVKSRSRPFQTYFESGFPHGKDQFIAASASSWATTALALSCPPR